MSKILITNKKIKAKEFLYEIPWKYDGMAYNMINSSPTKVINLNDTSWRKKLEKEFAEISSLFIAEDLDASDYEMIGNMKKLRSLYIFSAQGLISIPFISKLLSQRNLMICNSCISDITPIAILIKIQNCDTLVGRLACVAIIKSKISDLKALSGIERFSKFILTESLVDETDSVYRSFAE